MNKVLEHTRTKLLPYDEAGFLYYYPEFFRQLEDFADELEEQGPSLKSSQVTARWLEDGKSCKVYLFV